MPRGNAGAPPFGRLLRDFRRQAGLSQQALAEVSGLSVDAIAALERGRRKAPRAFTVRVLAQALELDERRAAALHAAASGEPEPRREPRLRVPPGPIVGRGEDVAALSGLLTVNGARCITLTGPGGIGKTRLALEVARTVAQDIPDDRRAR
jgi:transcriptional regulator with XRE-family HTH domain